MNPTLTNDYTPTNTYDSTNDKDILDLVFISPPIIPHFRYFWVGGDLGSDQNTIIGVFSHTPLIDEHYQHRPSYSTIRLTGKTSTKHHRYFDQPHTRHTHIN